jgi:hypothetical protein
MDAADIGAVASPWTLDGAGYLLTPEGVQKVHVDSRGTIHIDIIKPQACIRDATVNAEDIWQTKL